MYGLEMLYQSLYDLFNMNYISMAQDKYCRIAIGSDSIRGKVHPDFKVIIVADKDKVDGEQQNYDPPLLNRFEKQYLEPDDILQGEQVKMKNIISKLLDDYVSNKEGQVQIKPEDLEANSDDEGKDEFEEDVDAKDEKQIGDKPDKPKSAKPKKDKAKKQKEEEEEDEDDEENMYELQDIFPMLLPEMTKDLVYSLVLNFTTYNKDEEQTWFKFLETVPVQLLKLSCYSAILRLRFMEKISEDEFMDYKENLTHFDINCLLG